MHIRPISREKPRAKKWKRPASPSCPAASNGWLQLEYRRRAWHGVCLSPLSQSDARLLAFCSTFVGVAQNPGRRLHHAEFHLAHMPAEVWLTVQVGKVWLCPVLRL